MSTSIPPRRSGVASHADGLRPPLLRGRITRGVALGSLSFFVSMVGFALTFPFAQSMRDQVCDVPCPHQFMK